MFNQVKDERGILSAIEFKDLSFKPKRVFLLHNLNRKEERGGHYHKKCKQYVFILSGKCEVLLEFKKSGMKELIHSITGMCVYVPPHTKITIKKASKDCIVCVLCDRKYDPKDAYYD